MNYFSEIKKFVIDNPGVSDKKIQEKFGSNLEVNDAIVSLLSGNWIDPDGKGGYRYRPEPTQEEVDRILSEELYSGDYPWEH